MEYRDMRNAVRLSLKRAGMPQDDDLIQDGLLKLLEVMPKWRPDKRANRFTWALFCLRNHWIRRREAYLKRVDRFVSSEVPDPPDDRWPGRDAAELVLGDLVVGASLTTKERAAVTAFCTMGRDYLAAGTLGLSPRAFRERKKGAIQKLKRAWNDRSAVIGK